MGNIKKHIIYWILPSLVVISCILVYFLNPFGLSPWIAPEINREFGVVENLQILLLVIIFFTCIKGIQTSDIKRGRQVFRCIAAVTVLLFLEEIDYGLHYYDYLVMPAEQATSVMFIDYDNEVRNLHNNGKLTNISKMVAYASIIILFVIFPLLPAKVKQQYSFIGAISPSSYTVLTAASMLVINNIALYFYRYMEFNNAALKGNVSEFEEVFIYYLLFLYVMELVRDKKIYQILGVRPDKKKLVFNQLSSQ